MKTTVRITLRGGGTTTIDYPSPGLAEEGIVRLLAAGVRAKLVESARTPVASRPDRIYASRPA